MSNTFNSSLMPRILAGALDVLREECVLATKCMKDFRNAAAQLGDTVTVAVPTAQAVTDITPAAVPPSLADTTYGVKQVTINKWKKSMFHMTTKEATEYQSQVIIPMQVQEAARALAYQLNSDILANYTSIYGYAGTAGTDPFASNVNPVVDVKRVLDFQKCPDGNRMLVVGHAEETAALKLTDLRYFQYSGDKDAFRRGQVGTLFGINVFRDVQRPTHTAGSITTGLIAKAATAVAAGATSFAATTAASTGACDLKVGDIIQIGSSALETYTLTAVAVQASAATDVTLAISPGLRTALAGSEAITVKASHGVNIACDPGAFAVVMRTPPNSIEGAPVYGPSMVMADPVTGIPLKLSYLPGYHAAQWELSMLYGTAVIDPRRAARLAGTV